MKAFLYLSPTSFDTQAVQIKLKIEKNTSRFQFDHDKSYGIFEDKKKIMLERKGVRMGDYLFPFPHQFECTAYDFEEVGFSPVESVSNQTSLGVAE